MEPHEVPTQGEGRTLSCELSMDTVHIPDHYSTSLRHGHTASLDAAFDLRAQLEQEQPLQQEQQQQEQQQVLPLQRSLEVGQS
jgi:hypothetical protein